MADGPPKLVALNHDDYHAEHVGRTRDGRQFFLTTAFIPRRGGVEGNEFIALYLFDDAGKLLEAIIDELGPRHLLKPGQGRAVIDRRLQELGEVTPGRIEVMPFSVTRFGTEFGFIPRPPEEEGESWWVEVEPGNCMAFHEPWDSGDYDT